MHSSDDWESTLNEALVFFPPETLESCFKDPHRRFGRAEEALLRSGFYDGFETIRSPTALELLLRLRLRTLDQLADLCDAQLTRPLFQLWTKHLGESVEAMSVAQETDLYLQIVDHETMAVCRLIASVGSCQTRGTPPRRYVRSPASRSALLETLRVLNRVDDYPYVDTDRMLSSSALIVDRWENLLLRTTFFHFNELLARGEAPAPNDFGYPPGLRAP
jgi:hypothetical protein